MTAPLHEDEAETKQCKGCGEVKELSGFRYRHETLKGGRVVKYHANTCRECMSNKGQTRAEDRYFAAGPETQLAIERRQIYWNAPPVSERERYIGSLAACKGARVFTQDSWSSAELDLMAETCEMCPVKLACREEGDRYESTWGDGVVAFYVHHFRAGETPKQRIKRRLRALESKGA